MLLMIMTVMVMNHDDDDDPLDIVGERVADAGELSNLLAYLHYDEDDDDGGDNTDDNR